MSDERRATGALGEDLAAEWLAARGYRILARNWRLAAGPVRGELDLVCARDDVLVVVEVKTRRTDHYGGPFAAVTPTKAARIRRLAAAFLREAGLRVRAVRFDVVGVRLDEGRDPEVAHLVAAF